MYYPFPLKADGIVSIFTTIPTPITPATIKHRRVENAVTWSTQWKKFLCLFEKKFLYFRGKKEIISLNETISYICQKETNSNEKISYTFPEKLTILQSSSSQMCHYFMLAKLSKTFVMFDRVLNMPLIFLYFKIYLQYTFLYDSKTFLTKIVIRICLLI